MIVKNRLSTISSSLVHLAKFLFIQLTVYNYIKYLYVTLIILLSYRDN